MGDKILVAYASRCGYTGEVAKAIGHALGGTGTAVDVRPVQDVTDVRSYRAVIVGSAIRGDKWLPEAVKFVERHREALSRVPVGDFSVWPDAEGEHGGELQNVATLFA